MCLIEPLYFTTHSATKRSNNHILNIRLGFDKMKLSFRVAIIENTKYFIGECLPNLVYSFKIKNNNFKSIYSG